MLVRIITAVVLIAAVLLWLFVADYPIFAMGALFMYSVGAYEMGPLLGFKSRIPFLLIAMAAAVAAFVLVGNPGNFIITGIPKSACYITMLGIVVWLTCIPLLLKYPHNTAWHQHKTVNIILGILLLVPFLIGLLILRSHEYAYDQKAGSYLVLSVMALV